MQLKKRRKIIEILDKPLHEMLEECEYDLMIPKSVDDITRWLETEKIPYTVEKVSDGSNLITLTGIPASHQNTTMASYLSMISMKSFILGVIKKGGQHEKRNTKEKSKKAGK